jgi:hypothetical protein
MNKKAVIIFLVQLKMLVIYAQVPLIIEGTTVNNTISDSWEGVNIQRSVPTSFTYRNNSVSSVNNFGYMLQAGDESIGPTNNNLDGEVITGNKFTWNGSDKNSITHGIFTGHNLKAIIKYNYLNKVPMAIIRKSANNMTNSSGGIAYNIVYEPNVGVVIKGMSGVAIYNNTFFRNDDLLGRGFIDVYSNTDDSKNSLSHGTKILNNIFYTKNQTANIRILDDESLVGLQCDYNLYWCESGTPEFEVKGEMITFAEWQKLGYDTHSVIINPNFMNLTEFIPSAPLTYGTDLGEEWSTGLSPSAVWTAGASPATVVQPVNWQVGAIILSSGQGPASNPPVVAITNPANQSTFSIPEDITLTAQASDPDGAISLVEFFSGDIKIGETSTTPYSIIWQHSGSGSFSITAIATDNSNLKTVSLPVIINISAIKPDVVIYPNPSSGNINIRLDSAPVQGLYDISVYSVNGKKILEQQLYDTDFSQQLDISTLANGIYVIKIEGPDFRISKKIIKN